MKQKYNLKAVDMGIDTHQELVVYMREDCYVSRAEGFVASSRVAVSNGKHKVVIATINVVSNDALAVGTVGLSKISFKRLGLKFGDEVSISHPPVVRSLSLVRKKIFGHGLSKGEISKIIRDISNYQYSDIEIASFISACAGSRLDLDEIIGLTHAMVACGKKISWNGARKIFDKHCIGGIPGNRTTPLVVSIVSAAGLTVPKTSSRAITSPAGTADTMEAITRVNFRISGIRRVVDEAGACLAWGGGVNLSPADDILIRIERALELDGEGQLIASVLSKKIAAGSTHVVIDIPVGKTAKIRSSVEADRLASLFTRVGEACGIFVRCVITDGSHPIGAGIGPVEEARDLIKVLKRDKDSPTDLRERAILLAGHLFDLSDGEGLRVGTERAKALLDTGAAWKQFERIVLAQGGFKELNDAQFNYSQQANRTGFIKEIDNRKLARLAKLAGAPLSPSSGIRLHANINDYVHQDSLLFSLLSETQGERDYALDYYHNNLDMFTIVESQ